MSRHGDGYIYIVFNDSSYWRMSNATMGLDKARLFKERDKSCDVRYVLNKDQ